MDLSYIINYFQSELKLKPTELGIYKQVTEAAAVSGKFLLTLLLLIVYKSSLQVSGFSF